LEAWRQAAAIVVVFGLLAGVVYALRRRGGFEWSRLRAGPAKALIAVERLALTPQHTLHLVRLAGQQMLLATHPQGCTLLLERMAQPPGREAAPGREDGAARA